MENEMDRSNGTRVGLAAAAVLLALPSLAQNAARNLGFDTDLRGWTYDAGSVSWSSFDADGSASSGSALVLNSRPDFSAVLLTSPCLGVPNGAFDAGAKSFVRSGPSPGRYATVTLNTYEANDCSGTPTSQILPSFTPPSFDRWTAFGRYGNPAPVLTLPPPPGCPAFCPIEPGPGPRSARFVFAVSKRDSSTPQVTAYADDFFLRLATCVPDDSTLCLNGARFKVTASWESATASGHGTGLRLNDDTGSFSFFDADNTELVVKVLNACADPFNRYWVFGAGLTNVLVTLNVEDTQTGAVKTYVNPQGPASAPIQDTAAFATCP